MRAPHISFRSMEGDYLTVKSTGGAGCKMDASLKHDGVKSEITRDGGYKSLHPQV